VNTRRSLPCKSLSMQGYELLAKADGLPPLVL
jgi:hypothetical protein